MDPSQRALSVVVADEREEVLEGAAAAVAAAGHRVVAKETSLASVGDTVARTHADVVLVAMHEDAAHALALVEAINASSPVPTVLLLDHEDPPLVQAALDRGLASYVTQRTPAAITSAITLARRRFAEVRRLGRQVHDLEEGNERRAVIERAKGVVMERHGVDERRAYAMLRRHARDQRLSVSVVAEAVMRSHELLPGPAQHS